MPCEYIAPAFGFQKNFPFPVRRGRTEPSLLKHAAQHAAQHVLVRAQPPRRQDNELLESRIAESYSVCKTFGVSIGFHSGSGKVSPTFSTAHQPVCRR
jgi:hypothetical protein